MLPLHRIKPNGKIEIWDMGPKEPPAPVPPASVSDDLKGPKAVVARAEYETKEKVFKKDYEAYVAASHEYVRWHDKNDGPVKVDLWSIDAIHALNVDPDRYMVDLPKNAKPGKAQIEAEERAKSQDGDLAVDRDKDPQFGKGSV
jgi:hypothetical protein